MAAAGGGRGKRPARGRAPRAPARGRTRSRKDGSASGTRSPKTTSAQSAERAGGLAPAVDAAGTFPARLTLGAVPGSTPGKWIQTWRERYPATELSLEQIEVDSQREALIHGSVDVALVRHPIDREGLHLIPLYDEVPVVVMSTDATLSLADELTLDDLAGEVVIVPRDSVLDVSVPDAASPAFDAPADTAEAIATAASGVGVVIVPMSLARLHHRRDATFRPLADGTVSSVALAWRRDDDNAAIAAFVGVVRGRTVRSTRE